jgi:putative endonuclease
VLDTNAWSGPYELDLVARRGRVLVFCEVKSKTRDRFGRPAEMVTAEKQRRIRVAAQLWLQRHRECAGLQVRFDVIAERDRRIEHLPNAF